MGNRDYLKFFEILLKLYPQRTGLGSDPGETARTRFNDKKLNLPVESLLSEDGAEHSYFFEVEKITEEVVDAHKLAHADFIKLLVENLKKAICPSEVKFKLHGRMKALCNKTDVNTLSKYSVQLTKEIQTVREAVAEGVSLGMSFNTHPNSRNNGDQKKRGLSIGQQGNEKVGGNPNLKKNNANPNALSTSSAATQLCNRCGRIGSHVARC